MTTATANPVNLGDLLAAAGLVTREQLAHAVRVQRERMQEQRIGRILAFLGYVPQHVIERYAEKQARWREQPPSVDDLCALADYAAAWAEDLARRL